MDLKTGFELFRDDPDNQMVRHSRRFFRKYIEPDYSVSVLAFEPKNDQLYYRHGRADSLFARDDVGKWQSGTVLGESQSFKPFRIPVPDASLDAIFLWDVIGHAREPQKLLHESKRTLKPDGRLFIKDSNIAHPGVILHRKLKSMVLNTGNGNKKLDYYAYRLNLRGSISISLHEIGFVAHEVMLVEDSQAQAYFKNWLAWFRRRYSKQGSSSKSMQWARPTIIARCRKSTKLDF